MRYCIRCNTGLDDALGRNTPDGANPYMGLVFQASGNYGSTVFDPINPEEGQLEVVICDRCLLARKDVVRIGRSIYPVAEWQSKPWEPKP